MNKIVPMAGGAVLALLAGAYVAIAQPPGGAPGGPPGPPPQPMTFFVTSVGKGDGANLGGLAGADAHCQALAAAVGRGGLTWHAYLSTQGPGAVNARDRIGAGPWYNQRGQKIGDNVAQLHGDTLEMARLGNALGKQVSLTEKGATVNGVGDMPNQHDMLTGSTPDGRAYPAGADKTCSNWTSNAAAAQGAAPGTGPSAQLGHSDKQGGGTSSWNSAHASRGCNQAGLVATGGAGLFYCFAVN
ncbi:MAG TPA: hypothetical protein VL358_00235 [Caulobacteraceae bacterium]|jgi:hypothetical protein|nr:hypothetical protein [Caulobacteraceae bacterium]